MLSKDRRACRNSQQRRVGSCTLAGGVILQAFNYTENEAGWLLRCCKRQFTRTAWHNSIQDRKFPPQG
jgi:hypothetical protein